jgi:membrane fusion protein, macrolide-specific efflux system
MKPIQSSQTIEAPRTRPNPDGENTVAVPARKTKRPRRSLKWRAGLALVALVIAAGAGYAVKSTYFASKTTGFMTAPAKIGDVEVTVLTTGTLKPVKLVAVGAQVSGRITSVKVALGDQVKTGDLIAEIDSVTQQNALRTAKAALANVRAQKVEKEATLKKAELALARQKRMVAQNAVSRADYEAAEADVSTTQAQIDQLDAQIIEAEVAVETAQANLGYTRITAPIDGTVLSIVNQEGRTVNAAQSAPTIVILGQLDTMTIRAEISEADIVRVQKGQSVYFTILGDPTTRYRATLASIEPAPESITSDSSVATATSSSSSASSSSNSSSAIYYMGVFNVPNPDARLRTYMTAEVHIVLGEAKGVLTVPSAALGRVRRDGSAMVQVVGQEGSVEQRRVEVGINNKITAEIRSGLKEGERVVTGQSTAGTPTTQPRRPRGAMGL